MCIGQQMLFERSDEGDTPGPRPAAGPRRAASSARPSAAPAGLKVPHMGWNEVWQAAPHALWQGIADGSRFYFVHSYYCEPADAAARGRRDPLRRRLYLGHRAR